MSNLIPVSVQRPTLREHADARSRSRALASRAARGMRAPLVIHDLGSGTGSMMHWLAPLLPAPQTWVLHDWNADLLGHAAERAAVDSTGRPVAVTTSVKDVAHLRDGDLGGATLVTMSALLDVLTRDETEAVIRACVAAGAPALFTLSVTGRVSLDPVDPGRPRLRVRLQRPPAARLPTLAGSSDRMPEPPRSTSSSPPAGRSRSRRRPGCSMRLTAPSWTSGWRDGSAAAVEERPALEEWGDEYLRTRAVQLAEGTLKVVVDHQDFLAWPR